MKILLIILITQISFFVMSIGNMKPNYFLANLLERKIGNYEKALNIVLIPQMIGIIITIISIFYCLY